MIPGIITLPFTFADESKPPIQRVNRIDVLQENIVKIKLSTLAQLIKNFENNQLSNL